MIERIETGERSSKIVKHNGVAYLTGHLRQSGFDDVHFIDAMTDNISDEDLAARIADLNPDAIGVTAITPSIYAAETVLKIASEAAPDAPCVFPFSHWSRPDVKYFGCTDEVGYFGEAWCPTEVDANGVFTECSKSWRPCSPVVGKAINGTGVYSTSYKCPPTYQYQHGGNAYLSKAIFSHLLKVLWTNPLT